jgi:hypothetical protein
VLASQVLQQPRGRFLFNEVSFAATLSPMELQRYEVDALINEITTGKLKKSSKRLTISNSRLQAFLKKSGPLAKSVADLNFDDQGEDGFADALLQLADTANEIGAKAQARALHTSLHVQQTLFESHDQMFELSYVLCIGSVVVCNS